MLDVGLPLTEPDADTMSLHPVPGFDKPDDSLLGVVISHPHQDHYGLAYRLPRETTFLMGQATQSILEAASLFTPAGLKVQHAIHLENRKTIQLGPFQITPYLVDHSAYDSYAILVEADGKRLFYSGDFRTHGRKGALVDQLIAHPPRDVDVLLMEGTTLGRPAKEQNFPTEDELENRFIESFESCDGMSLVWASGQNIDRLVTLYKACRKAGRKFIIDVYTAHILQATGNERIPQAGWRDIRIYLPFGQKMRILKDRSFELVEHLKPYRIYPEQFPAVANNAVMLFRPSMMRDLDRIDGLRIGQMIHSMWLGYLKDDQTKPLLDWCKAKQIPMEYCHTSGHATAEVIARMTQAIDASQVVPVHTEKPEFLSDLSNRVKPASDGEWRKI